MNIVNTKRLVLEQATPLDAEFILRLMNSPNLIEYVGDRGIKTIKMANEYVQKTMILSYEKNGYGLLIMKIKENRNPIGLCGFLKRDFLDYADIGFGILPEHEGKGYTFEAANAMLEFGKVILKLEPILAFTSFENCKSQNLLHKIGLKEIGKINPFDKELLLYSN